MDAAGRCKRLWPCGLLLSKPGPRQPRPREDDPSAGQGWTPRESEDMPAGASGAGATRRSSTLRPHRWRRSLNFRSGTEPVVPSSPLSICYPGESLRRAHDQDRQSLGDRPENFLNARLNAASDS